MAGKSGFMKDAFIVFAITLISGIALGGVYEVDVYKRQAGA